MWEFDSRAVKIFVGDPVTKTMANFSLMRTVAATNVVGLMYHLTDLKKISQQKNQQKKILRWGQK